MIKIKTKDGSKTIQISVYIKGTFKNYLPKHTKKHKNNHRKDIYEFPLGSFPPDLKYTALCVSTDPSTTLENQVPVKA